MSTTKVMTLAGPGSLTTDHAESSYGKPILIVDGVAYGPGDKIGREFPFVAEYKGSPAPTLVFDLAAALDMPPMPAALAEWNKNVLAAHKAGDDQNGA